MASINSRYIRDVDVAESLWLAWLAEQRIPSASLQALCADHSRLVVVAPHPDDEVLACGGLLAMRAACGLSCFVVAVTDGEASHGSLDLQACSRLSKRRVAERNAGLRVLGFKPSCIARLRISDGDVGKMIPAITEKLLLLLHPSDVVVTTWALDGHPDHEATSVAAQQAAAAIGCRFLQAPVWMWHWASPGHPGVPWQNLVALDLPAWALSTKQHALSCHLSQLEKRSEGLGPVLVPSIVERAARVREYYFF